MRQVGSLPNEHDATQFAAYLVAVGIDAHAEQDHAAWTVWVRDENSITKAKELFDEYRQQPDNDRYRTARRDAESLLRQKAERRSSAEKNVISMKGRWNQTTTRRAPLTMTMIGLSVIVTLVGGFHKADKGLGGTINRQLSFCDISAFEKSANPLVTVARGELWRTVTPIFLHLDPLHLAFNMIMFFQFGSMVESVRGTSRFGLIVLLAAVLSNVSQAVFPPGWGGSPIFGGMSGVVYGLFGYVWLRTLFRPEPGLYLGQVTVIVLIGWLFLCMTDAVGNVANVAHVVGLITGMACGYVPIFWKK